jgi:transposase
MLRRWFVLTYMEVGMRTRRHNGGRRTGRRKAPLSLTSDEQARLTSVAHRSRSAAALARRARIILACAEGIDSKVVARRRHVTPGTVCKWRGRFVRDRLEGLYDEPRPGAKRTITDDQVEAVVIRTLETKPAGATHWSTRSMAKAMGLNHTAISRIWHAFGLQPHRSETFKLSNDPLLVEESARDRRMVREPAAACGRLLRG